MQPRYQCSFLQVVLLLILHILIFNNCNQRSWKVRFAQLLQIWDHFFSHTAFSPSMLAKLHSHSTALLKSSLLYLQLTCKTILHSSAPFYNLWNTFFFFLLFYLWTCVMCKCEAKNPKIRTEIMHFSITILRSLQSSPSFQVPQLPVLASFKSEPSWQHHPNVAFKTKIIW